MDVLGSEDAVPRHVDPHDPEVSQRTPLRCVAMEWDVACAELDQEGALRLEQLHELGGLAPHRA
eukprot:COSAG06_NODE_1641_length_8829_cov_23.966667_1_plen_64_part_00